MKACRRSNSSLWPLFLGKCFWNILLVWKLNIDTVMYLKLYFYQRIKKVKEVGRVIAWRSKVKNYKIYLNSSNRITFVRSILIYCQFLIRFDFLWELFTLYYSDLKLENFCHLLYIKEQHCFGTSFFIKTVITWVLHKKKCHEVHITTYVVDRCF